MVFEIGVLFALAALFCWGFGDFLIQRATRKIGDWETLFFITAIGALALTPFVYNNALALMSNTNALVLLLISSAIFFTAALLDFEALRKGKIAIVEPVLALEVPVASAIAFGVLQEMPNATQLYLIAAIMIGIFLVSLKGHHLSRRVWLEKGVLLMGLAAALMGTSNFLIGYASRVTNPLLTNWFTSLFMALCCFAYLIKRGSVSKLSTHLARHTRLVFTVSAFDNLAWIFFAYAASLIPIAIALALSEGYIALAALLGVLVNRERLLNHQKVGLITTLVGAIALAVLAV